MRKSSAMFYTITVFLFFLLQGLPAQDVFTQTEHGGTDADSDLYLLPGPCDTCHTMHDSEDGVPAVSGGPFGSLLLDTPDNTFCTGCHIDSTTGSIPQQPPTGGVWTGDAVFDTSAHGLATAKTDPDSGNDLPHCVSCHDPHGSGLNTPYPDLTANYQESLCTGCHDSDGPAATNIASCLTGTSVSTAVYYSNAPTNTRHDFFDADQTANGTLIECRDCHNPHLNNTYFDGISHSKMRDPSVDPLNTSSDTLYLKEYNKDDPDRAGDLDPNILPESPSYPIPDYIDFCLTCHDGTTPSWINAGTTPPMAIDWSRAFHGEGFGGANSTVGYCKSQTPTDPGYVPNWPGKPGYVDPYTGADYRNMGVADAANSYAPLLCIDCHDPHGVSSNAFMIKETVNGKSGISWPDGSAVYASLCLACHILKLNGGPHGGLNDSSSCAQNPHTHYVAGSLAF